MPVAGSLAILEQIRWFSAGFIHIELTPAACEAQRRVSPNRKCHVTYSERRGIAHRRLITDAVQAQKGPSNLWSRGTSRLILAGSAENGMACDCFVEHGPGAAASAGNTPSREDGAAGCTAGTTGAPACGLSGGRG